MDWHFKGMLQKIITKEFASGHKAHELVIVNAGGKYESMCVCTAWGKVDAVEGDEVEAEGYMAGRFYEAGNKYYPGLKVQTIKVCEGRTVLPPVDRVEEQRARDAEVVESDGLPF